MEVREGTPLLLVAGVVAGQETNADVRSFLQFLNTPEAQRVYLRAAACAPHMQLNDLWAGLCTPRSQLFRTADR